MIYKFPTKSDQFFFKKSRSWSFGLPKPAQAGLYRVIVANLYMKPVVGFKKDIGQFFFRMFQNMHARFKSNLVLFVLVLFTRVQFIFNYFSLAVNNLHGGQYQSYIFQVGLDEKLIIA